MSDTFLIPSLPLIHIRGSDCCEIHHHSRDGAAYSYDYLGNPTNAADDGLFYGVNAENRVVDVDDSSGDVAGYTYDMLGRRIKKTVGSLTTWFVYDKMGGVIAEYEQIGTGSITWARDYVYGASGELVCCNYPQRGLSGGIKINRDSYPFRSDLARFLLTRAGGRGSLSFGL
ncbi:hypothetical protein SMSP2_02054 [Limihaloglobus sulfuriphilus]|uniref:Uncharacterized protein n=1 Tax=Limihaloglobus sulfuriphilus TaxID=1851148 RepID=A0A1Q2MHA5_9BACT|nr:hypothetical protein [Limihaloglobus sulfuriphilus]AQQ71677.1 hypothetical protein SMSP2_02054 [Limihaloglobus sulfuriphilus]